MLGTSSTTGHHKCLHSSPLGFSSGGVRNCVPIVRFSNHLKVTFSRKNCVFFGDIGGEFRNTSLLSFLRTRGFRKKPTARSRLCNRASDFRDLLTEYENALQDSSFAADSETELPFLQAAISEDLKASFIVLPAPDNHIEFCHECKTRDARNQVQKSLNQTLPMTNNGNSAPTTRLPARSTFVLRSEPSSSSLDQVIRFFSLFNFPTFRPHWSSFILFTEAS